MSMAEQQQRPQDYQGRHRVPTMVNRLIKRWERWNATEDARLALETEFRERHP